MELNYKKLVTPEVKYQLEMAILRVKNGEMAEDAENDFPQWKEENTGDVVWGAEDPL